MAALLNKFYVNIGKTVEEKIPKVNKTLLHYLSDRNTFNIVLNLCSIEEIRKYISDMTVSKATGPISIPTNFLKQFTDELIEPDYYIQIPKRGHFPRYTKVCISLSHLQKKR